MADLLPLDHPLAPKYWRNETSGVLAPAIERYLRKPRTMTLRDVALVRAYVKQWIDSPVWEDAPRFDDADRANLNELRRLADEVESVEDLHHWFAAALDMGHDPL